MITYPAITAQVSGNTAGATAYLSSGTVVFAGGANITLSQVGNNVSIVGGGGGGGAAISAAGASASNGTVVFSNSNGVSFGMAGSTVTATVKTDYLTTAMASNRGSDFVQANAAFAGTSASGTIASNGISISIGPYLTTAMQSNAATLSNIRVSGGTTSNLLSALTFGDANGVSFGLNASTMTASHNGLTSQSNQNVTAGNGGFAFQTLSFSNANGISFGTSAGSAITASHNALTSQSNQAFSADASSTFQTLSFQDSNGVSFSNNAGALRVTHALQFTSATSAITSNAMHSTSRPAFSADASSTFQTLTLQNSNGISFSNNAGAIRLTHDLMFSSQSRMSLYAVSNTTQSTSNTVPFSALSFHGAGIASVGVSNGSVIVSVPAGAPSPVNFSAGTTSGNLGSVVFSNGNGVSFGLDGATITGSHNGLTSQSNQAFSAAGGSSAFQTLGFSDNAYASWTNTNGSVALQELRGSFYAASNTTQGTSMTQNLDALTFAGAGVASVGMTNGSVVISVPSGGGGVTNTQRWQYPPGNLTAVAAAGNGSFSINRVQVEQNISATRIDCPLLISMASSATANTFAPAFTVFACIYTKNVSTLSSLSSGQVQWVTSLASNTAGNTGLIAHAIRPLSVGFNINMTPGEYYVGFGYSSTASSSGTATTANGMTLSVMGGPIYSSAVGQVGDFTAASNTSTGLYGGQGIYSAAISTVPPTVSLSAINQTGSYYARGNMGLIFRNI